MNNPTQTHIRWNGEEMKAVVREHVRATGGVTITKKHVMTAQTSALQADRHKCNPQEPLFINLNKMMQDGHYQADRIGDPESTASLSDKDYTYPAVEPRKLTMADMEE